MQTLHILQSTMQRHLSRLQPSSLVYKSRTGYQGSNKTKAYMSLSRSISSLTRQTEDKIRFPTRQLGFLKQNKVNGTLFFKTSDPSLNGVLFIAVRSKSGGQEDTSDRTVVFYVIGFIFFMLGLSALSVPLYKLFCQQTGFGGQPTRGHDATKLAGLSPVDREITVKFVATVNKTLKWRFVPQQRSVVVKPGETCLAFFTAKNMTDRPVTGIATYNVLPYQAAVHFNKVQCFCFEEQRLNPNEEVDMPVFFYIDPEYAEDVQLHATDIITLSYTFYESDGKVELPLPGYVQHVDTAGNKIPQQALVLNTKMA